MKFTIFGGRGFIGRHLVEFLQSSGHQVVVPAREDVLNEEQCLGHVIYAIGMTGNFRARPFDTVDAHVGFLMSLLRHHTYESFLYLSSTRIYSGLNAGALGSELTPVPLSSGPDALYDLSKMLGESLCLSIVNPKVRIARLSNVFGRGQSEHTFLGSILAAIKSENRVEINEAPESCKDYVWIDDVVPVLVGIAMSGKDRIYNVASGECITHVMLVEKLTEILHCTASFNQYAGARVFPQIDVSRIKSEFGFTPVSLLEKIPFS